MIDNLITGYSGVGTIELVLNEAKKINQDHRIVSLSMHNPYQGYGGITTVFRSVQKLFPDIKCYFLSKEDSEIENQGNHIFIDPSTIELFQRTYGKIYLWPALHNIPYSIIESEVPTLRSSIDAFCSSYVEQIQDSDGEDLIIWLQDYLFAFMGTYVRQKFPKAKIILSIRSAFGKQQIPELFYDDSKLLVESLIQSDFCSFHRKVDLENFFSMARQVLDTKEYFIDEKRGCISTHKHVFNSRVIPMGNDYEYRQSLLNNHNTLEHLNFLKEITKNRKVISSLSTFELHKGIITELALMKRFLQKYPQYHTQFVFLRVMPIRKRYENLIEYVRLKEYVFSTIESINAEYGSKTWQPIVTFFDQNGVNDYQSTALFRLTDILLVLSKLDGFNHVALEGVFSKGISDKPLSLVLGDVGATDYIEGCCKVDCDNLEELTEKFVSEYIKTDEEKQKSFSVLLRYCRHLSALQWSFNVVQAGINLNKLPVWKGI